MNDLKKITAPNMMSKLSREDMKKVMGGTNGAKAKIDSCHPTLDVVCQYYASIGYPDIGNCVCLGHI